MAFTESNHYVPQWYQRQFLPKEGERKYFYLDLKPDSFTRPDGTKYTREARRRLGPINCFAEKHLYTLFFGKIDDNGAEAVSFFIEYDFRKCGVHEAFQHIVPYLGAQKFRTPKGLDYIKMISGRSHETVVAALKGLLKFYGTIWTEGVWEILCADDSSVKFIVSDNPVTTYNKRIFPLAPISQYPCDAPTEQVGTHTLFPLSPARCLVITNLEYVRNPNIDLLSFRENARYFETTMFDLRTVQTGRQIPEEQVCAINYILKSRAKRYIASAEEKWLYPERQMKTTYWNKLGGRFFLMPDPRKVHFKTFLFAGNEKGPTWGADEYGRHSRDDDHAVKAKRDREYRTFQNAKRLWDVEFGQLTPDELGNYF